MYEREIFEPISFIHFDNNNNIYNNKNDNNTGHFDNNKNDNNTGRFCRYYVGNWECRALLLQPCVNIHNYFHQSAIIRSAG